MPPCSTLFLLEYNLHLQRHHLFIPILCDNYLTLWYKFQIFIFIHYKTYMIWFFVDCILLQEKVFASARVALWNLLQHYLNPTLKSNKNSTWITEKKRNWHTCFVSITILYVCIFSNFNINNNLILNFNYVW